MDWTLLASVVAAVAAVPAAVYGGLAFHHQRKRNKLEDNRYFDSLKPSIACMNRTSLTSQGNPAWHKLHLVNEGRTFSVDKIYSVDGRTKATVDASGLSIKRNDKFQVIVTPGLLEGEYAKVVLHVRTTDNTTYCSTIILRNKSEEITSFLAG